MKRYNKATAHKKRLRSIGKSWLVRKRFSRILHILGPGLVTGAADDDPSGIATYSQVGAGYGFTLLWAFPAMLPLLAAVQESCSRIGAVTGKGLAAIIKQNYSKRLLYPAVALVVIANTVNIGADLGAMAATIRLFVNIPFGIVATVMALIIILLVVTVNYTTYAKVLKWLAVTLLAYPAAAILIGQDWGKLFSSTFLTLPHFNISTVYIIVGLLGTTISPYLFFWDTSEVVEDEISEHRLTEKMTSPHISKRFIKNIRIDNFIGMALATITGWFVVVVCASVLFKNGVTQINSASDAARALEPLVSGVPHAGVIAKLIFSVGIIGIGMLAIPVLAGSSSYAVTETLGWKEGLHRKFGQALGFYGVIIVATLVGLTINFVGIDPIKALIFTAVFNGIASVPLLIIISKIGKSEAIMGSYKSGLLSRTLVQLAFLVNLAAVLVLFISYIMQLGK